MKQTPMRTWTGPAITAKIFTPVALAFIAGLIAVPIRDILTAAWFFLVVLPAGGAAIWLFLNIGEIGPSSDGIVYRKWVRWQHIPSSEISNVVRVFPCFAALVLNERVRLFFFPDTQARRLIRSLPGALRGDDTKEATSTTVPIILGRASPLTAICSLFIGAVSGVAIGTIPGFAGHQANKETTLTLFERGYVPVFVGVSILYLIGLAVGRRLKAKEVHLSLALIGLGIVYLSTVVSRLL